MKKQACVICDIDGVYVDSREWNKYAPKEHDDRAGWDEFGKHVDACKPNPPVIKVISILSKVFPIIFLTSREDTGNMREATIEQLQNFSNGKIKIGEGSKNKLYMRTYEDYRRSYIVKEEILKKEILPSYYPIMALDDDKGNIRMFENNGINTIHYTDLRFKHDKEKEQTS